MVPSPSGQAVAAEAVRAPITLEPMETREDRRWTALEITPTFLEEKAAWLSEPRGLDYTSANFFRLAGTLVSFSRFEYEFASLAFFQAVIGLEKALTLHFEAEDGKFSELLGKAVSKGLVTDALFQDPKPISDDLLMALMPQPSPPAKSFNALRRLRKKWLKEARTMTHNTAQLCQLVPKLRNQFFHGTYRLSPEFLNLTFQMREIADVLPPPKDLWRTRKH